jgi:prophage antirepressor-like protein
MDFFLDIFNKLLKINETHIFILFDKQYNIWFKFRDILIALGYTDIKHLMLDMKINSNNKVKYTDLKGVGYIPPPSSNFQKNTIFINESGLYEVLSKSTKPIAKIFMKKYFMDIMPQIRKTGKYIANNNEQDKINKMNEKIENYKQELTYYNDKYKFIPSKGGYIYILVDYKIVKGKKIKCYKIGFCYNMNERIKNYKIGNFMSKMLCYIPIDINAEDIEKIVKYKLKPHLTKLITDTVCYLSLDSLKNEIIECINFMSSHICNCNHCYKKYKFNNITKHSCNKNLNFINLENITNYNKNTKKNSKRLSNKFSKRTSKTLSKKIVLKEIVLKKIVLKEIVLQKNK